MFGRWRKNKQKPPTIAWQGLLSAVFPHKESHSIFAVREGDNWEPIDCPSSKIPEDIVGIVLAYDVEGVEPWHTEVPAKYMAEKLSGILDMDLPYFLSRSSNHYAGYYVDISSRFVTNTSFHLEEINSSNETNNLPSADA